MNTFQFIKEKTKIMLRGYGLSLNTKYITQFYSEFSPLSKQWGHF